MDIQTILSHCEHTLLATTATWEDIRMLCDDAIAYSVAAVCIPPCYVKQARKYLKDNMKIVTVVGFPNGNTTTEVKVFEAAQAIKNGADEVDMVINIGALKEQNYKYVLNEIKAVKEACGEHVLKVIIETCMLTDAEKIKMCEIVTESGADYIKTSTGFSKAGAKIPDVQLFAKHIGKNVKIKAAGGIQDATDAANFINVGADRIGASRIVNALKLADANKDI